jgi:hypothetical protein
LLGEAGPVSCATTLTVKAPAILKVCEVAAESPLMTVLVLPSPNSKK